MDKIERWDPALAGSMGNSNFNVWADLAASYTLKARYLHGDSVDQLFARIDKASNGPETAYWYLTDHQGSITNVLSQTGQILDTVTYDAFGNFTQSTTNSSILGRYAWTGREFDVETGLQYNHARYYDPQAGRWISQDPMGFDAGDCNLYRYVNNRPTGGTDQSGTREIPITRAAFDKLTFQEKISADKDGNSFVIIDDVKPSDGRNFTVKDIRTINDGFTSDGVLVRKPNPLHDIHPEANGFRPRNPNGTLRAC